jgi:hypothetical protein
MLTTVLRLSFCALVAIAPQAGVLLANARSAPAPAASPSPTPIPLFQPIISKLLSETSVPLLLPTLVPVNPSAEVTPVASLNDTDANGYEVDLNATSGCSGQGCFIGLIKSIPAIGPIDLSDFSYYQTATLANGITAIVGNPSYRNPTTIVWNQSGRRYILVLIVANFPQDLVNMANSMTQY